MRSCCEKDNKLSNVMKSLPNQNYNNNDVLHTVNSELEIFKSTTLASLQGRFIAAIEKCNKNEYFDEITDMCSKMLKLTESHNTVIKNLKTQSEHADNDKDEKIKNLEIDNAILRKSKGPVVNIDDEEMQRKLDLITKERDELERKVKFMQAREKELILTIQTKEHEKACIEEDHKCKLKTENMRLMSNITCLNEKVSSLENIIDVKKKALDSYRERTVEIENRNNTLEKSLDSAKDEIISLKSHTGSMSSKDDWSSQEQATDAVSFNQPVHGKPKVLLLGTSNVKDIEPSRFTSKVEPKKELKYTIEEAKEYTEENDTQYDAIARHVN